MKYDCTICGYVYDEVKEKVPFKDLPDTWTCPLCGAPKSAFAPLEDKKRRSKEPFQKSEVKIWECRNCGHLVIGTKAPEICSTCGYAQSFFELNCENY